MTKGWETNEQRAPARILIVTPRYVPLVGGVENHVREVVRRMPPDLDVTILTTDATGSLPTEDAVDGVRVLRSRAYPRGADYYVAPSLYGIVARGGWNLVHVQSYHTAVAPLAMLAARSAHIPYVITLHGGGHSSQLRNALRSTQHRMLRPLLAHAEKIISVAEFEADSFSRRLGIPLERFVVIPNGSDLPSPGDSAPARRPEARPTIASVGRLEKYKGHHRVVEAMPELLRLGPDTELHIVGSGPYEQAIGRLAQRLGVADHVRIYSIPSSDRVAMAEALRGFSLFVLMSEFETHPLAVMEALALGCPALVADTSGLRELAQHGLARALPLDSTPSDIATAISQELHHPTQVPPLTLPSWDECAAGVLAVYREVLASRFLSARVARIGDADVV